MDEHERALASDQYALGVKHANTVADIITEQFPPGVYRSTRFVRRKLRKMTNQSLAGLARVSAQLASLQTSLPSTIVSTVKKAKSNRVL
jgi:hypothetical protein